MTITSQEIKAPRWRDWIAALVLFFATALVVVWQNFRLGVLWDLSYILENSYRISLGDIPYRDFPPCPCANNLSGPSGADQAHRPSVISP